MFKVLKKKNSEYTITEQWITSIITFSLFALLGYWGINNANIFQPQSVFPYLTGGLIGAALGFVGFKYPKIIHISIFALPLMFIGT